MNILFYCFLLICLIKSIILQVEGEEEENELFIYIDDPTFYKDGNNQELKCVGKNFPSEIFVTFSEVSRQSTTSNFTVEVKNIKGSKLINFDTRKEIDLLCYNNATVFYCEKEFSEEEKEKNILEPGEYYYSAEEIKSGEPEIASIRGFSSENSFQVVDKYYVPFPYLDKDFDLECVFEENSNNCNLVIEYQEIIKDPPTFSLGDKKFDCKVNEKNNKQIICNLNDNDFKPSKNGIKYYVDFYNVCGEKEGKGTIVSVLKEKEEEKKDDKDDKKDNNNKKDGFVTYVLPTIIGGMIIIGIVIIIIVIKLNKDIGDKDLGQIMATSYASEGDRKINEENENVAQETLE